MHKIKPTYIIGAGIFLILAFVFSMGIKFGSKTSYNLKDNEEKEFAILSEKERIKNLENYLEEIAEAQANIHTEERISYLGNSFNPKELEIVAGTGLIFENKSDGNLWLISPNSNVLNQEKYISKNETFKFTFTEKGEYIVINKLGSSAEVKILVK